jgi:hypothetical protein
MKPVFNVGDRVGFTYLDHFRTAVVTAVYESDPVWYDVKADKKLEWETDPDLKFAVEDGKPIPI